MDHRIQLSLALIGTNLASIPKAPEVACRVGLSASRFYELFRHETGSTPADYVRRMRLESARELLETSMLSVKEIAGTVGAKDVSHFVRGFKKAYAMSPRAYRAAHFLGGKKPAVRAVTSSF